MIAIKPSKKSIIPTITISQPANEIQPVQVLERAITAPSSRLRMSRGGGCRRGTSPPDCRNLLEFA